MASSSSSSPELPHAAASSSHQFAPVQYSDLSREEVLEDLSSRFILNLPEEELASVERVCFQVEQAHWYYEDFVREQNPSKFPSYTLKTFSEALFHACPLLAHWAEDHDRTFDSFMKYKTRVPVCGAIMLNNTWDKCVLVKGWKSSAGWGFPKGKINEQEPKYRCAIREVLEETGYNLEGQLDPENVIQLSIKEQSISLYIVPGVPEDFEFKTKTRKEISKISWFKLTDLPTWKRNRVAPGKFYLITPFVPPLKHFIHDRKQSYILRKPSQPIKEEIHSSGEEDGATVNDQASVGNSQELSSQASSAEPQTPSPQYSAARVHQATFDSSIDSSTADPARPAPSLDVGDNHLASLLTSLQRSAASLVLEAPLKAQATLSSETTRPASLSAETVRPATSSTETTRPTVDLSPDWSARMPTMRPMPTGIPQTQSSPALSPHPQEATSLNPIPRQEQRSTVTGPTVSPMLRQAGHARRGSSVATDVSPYLSHPRNITKEMRYISILESVAQESDRTASRMSFRPETSPMVPTVQVAHGHVPHLPHPPVMDKSVLFTSTMHSHPHHGPPPHSMYPPHIPEGMMARPRTSHTLHGAPFPSSGSRQSMNEHQLRSMLPLNGQWNNSTSGPFPPSPALGPPPFTQPYARVPTSPARALPPYHFPPTHTPHIAHNNVVRAANNAQLLSILNTPNPVYRA
ncbi:DCP2-domain-containing protein [Epithele typhae]|uniref:DCP2-domain-containing protein n=1 Tax=Epithele typhae TaxID=378194 RepID=UPI002008B5E2|nr:DCP2-domain-containing protein [Epithele typhae]KAH9944361.1 DCP2-domain-containing protein [Epithele typhae]